MADFDPNQYLAEKSGSGGGFDPDAYLAQKAQPMEPLHKNDWSQGQSFGQGALQGVTGGFSDELGGAMGALQEKILPGGNPDNKSVKELYQEYRDFNRQRNHEAEQAHPTANLAGNIAGGIGGAVVAPEALAAKSVAGAAGIGAATGLGTSEHDLTDPSLESIKGAAIDTTIGGALGTAGGLIGNQISKKLAPEALEMAASKNASKAVGLKPSKELTRVFDPATKRMVEGPDIIKGVGKTALEEGALPMTGGAENIYQKSIDAINHNYNKLNPIIANTQSKLNSQIPQSIEEVGSIGQKTATYLNDFRKGLAENPDATTIMDKIDQKYIPYIEQMNKADGDLQKLTAFKRALQEKATDLSKAAYDQPASDLKPEAEFVKNLGGIVRQHIEDLAGTVDSEAADQISQTNKTLSNLYTYKDSAKKLLDKSPNSLGVKDVGVATAGILSGHPIAGAALVGGKYALEKATGNPIGRLSDIALAKGQMAASKAIQTPSGQLAQKAIVNAPNKIVTNPFTQDQVQQRFNPSEASKLSTNLYNATDESLKNVASKLKSSPGLEFYANHLNNAIDTNNYQEKDRAIFLIMQNPKSRKLITPVDVLKEEAEKASKKR